MRSQPGVGAGPIVEPTALAAGGDAIARDSTGRVVFVAGALPGEAVEVEFTDERRDYARARVLEVLSASPDRVTPPCPHLGQGCGGCDLQHAAPTAQPGLKAALVVDALRRIGRISEPAVRVDAPLPAVGYRTTVRMGVRRGRAGFRRRRRHDLVDVDSCLVADPRLEEIIVEGRFGDADEVTLRVGHATGERLALVSPSADDVLLPADVAVVGADGARHGHPTAFHDVVEGHRFRVSARSFFQANGPGTPRLVEVVRDAAGDELDRARSVVDAYSGVGLLAATVAAGGDRQVTAVEWARSSVADARHNLAGLDVSVVRSDVARWDPGRADLVIADPSRTGLGAQAVDRLARTGATRLVLVSCDAAALGRDTSLLAEAGFGLRQATLVDLFPHTHHVEVVSRFDRGGL
jgi:23S rRNA (uracil1939-C5)-methyltransferase